MQRGVERVLVADHSQGCQRHRPDCDGLAVPLAGDVLARDGREAVAEHLHRPLLRTLRVLADEEPGHPVEHCGRGLEVSLAAGIPGRTGQLPDVVVAGVDFDPGIFAAHEAVEVDLLGEHYGIKVVELPGILGKGYTDPVEVIERQQPRGGIAEVADRIVPIRDRLEDVAAVVASIVAVAAERVIVSATPFVVALGVLDQRAMLAGWKQRPEHPVDRRAAGLRIVEEEQPAARIRHDLPPPRPLALRDERASVRRCDRCMTRSGRG